ncbi:MAG: YheV family putative metal-binding protein [Parahaliea sp.]
MPDHTRRRFIAGAVCPRCSAMDTLVVDLDSDRRECVSCGFGEARPGDAPQQEPLTRVNRPRRRGEAPAEAVRLISPDTD